MKNEPTPTVTVDHIEDEKSNGEEKTESDPPPSPETNQKPVIKLSDSTNSSPFLRPSPSETSLSRSRSLEFIAQPKHSPDCKDNPYKL